MIDKPTPEQLDGLRTLWVEAFGEPRFWDAFFAEVFSADHCRCLSEDGVVAAALYWLDCELSGRKLAYLYAVATRRVYRHRGLCHRLMADTHSHLREAGYSGTLLVPEHPPLRQLYAQLGYRDCTAICEFACDAGPEAIPLRRIDRAEYAARRRALLPPGGVTQEGGNLSLLTLSAGLWAGDGLLFAASQEGGTLLVPELLGDPSAAPAIVRALGCTRGQFRAPGTQTPFAMFRPLEENAPSPGYFGLAFD